jgi:hypothetical protein
LLKGETSAFSAKPATPGDAPSAFVATHTPAATMAVLWRSSIVQAQCSHR